MKWKTVLTTGLWTGGVLLMAVPSFAGRLGSEDRSPSRTDSSSDSRSDSRAPSRSESRSDGPSRSPGASAPRYDRSPAPASPSWRGGTPAQEGPSWRNSSPAPVSPSWRSNPPVPSQATPVPTRTWPAPSSAPTDSPSWRSGGAQDRSPRGTWNNNPPTMGGNPYGVYSTPTGGDTPSRYGSPSGNDSSPSRYGNAPSGDTASPSGRTSGGDTPIRRGNSPSYSPGGSTDRSPRGNNSPSRRPQPEPSRGNGGTVTGSDGPTRGNGNSSAGPSTRPFEPPSGPMNRGTRSGGGRNDGPSRTGGPERTGGYDRGTGTVLPSRDPTPPSGGFTPPSGIAGGPVRTWRPPSRMPSRAPDNSGVNPGRGNRPTDIPRRIGTGRPVEYTPARRPPSVDHRHWRDNDWFYGGRHFYTIGLGYGSPFYCYDYPSFFSINFYYPYYYCGPYFSGAYYSPFWVYGGWLPTYVYPERVIYIERRVYIHDVIQDEDDYDLYGNALQSSLRDTLDDIKSAWLNGEGGRLLLHINEVVPVRVYQRGEYKYSLQPEDFRDMTKDALNRVQTVSFEWTKIDKRHSDEVYLEAKQVFRDPDGEDHAIRLTYTLEKAKGGWWITETGTSKWNEDI